MITELGKQTRERHVGMLYDTMEEYVKRSQQCAEANICEKLLVGGQKTFRVVPGLKVCLCFKLRLLVRALGVVILAGGSES